MHTYIHTYILTYPIGLPFIKVYILIHTHLYIHTIRAYHIYIHTIHTIQTYIHAYIHTYRRDVSAEQVHGGGQLLAGILRCGRSHTGKGYYCDMYVCVCVCM